MTKNNDILKKVSFGLVGGTTIEWEELLSTIQVKEQIKLVQEFSEKFFSEYLWKDINQYF